MKRFWHFFKRELKMWYHRITGLLLLILYGIVFTLNVSAEELVRSNWLVSGFVCAAIAVSSAMIFCKFSVLDGLENRIRGVDICREQRSAKNIKRSRIK